MNTVIFLKMNAAARVTIRICVQNYVINTERKRHAHATFFLTRSKASIKCPQALNGGAIHSAMNEAYSSSSCTLPRSFQNAFHTNLESYRALGHPPLR